MSSQDEIQRFADRQEHIRNGAPSQEYLRMLNQLEDEEIGRAIKYNPSGRRGDEQTIGIMIQTNRSNLEHIVLFRNGTSYLVKSPEAKGPNADRYRTFFTANKYPYTINTAAPEAAEFYAMREGLPHDQYSMISNLDEEPDHAEIISNKFGSAIKSARAARERREARRLRSAQQLSNIAAKVLGIRPNSTEYDRYNDQDQSE